MTPGLEEETLGPAGGAVTHSLAVAAPGEPVRQVTIGPGPLLVGRVPPAGLVLPYPEVSRRHAEFAVSGAAVRVVDLQSTNGVWIDGVRIDETATLVDGQRLRIGHVVLDYSRSQARPAAPPPAPPPPTGLRDAALLAAWRAGGAEEAVHATSVGGGVFTGFVLGVSGPGAAASAARIARALREGMAGAGRPAETVGRLNAMLLAQPPDRTVPALWCWAYDSSSRVLEYCSAGHPPAFLLAPDRMAAVALDKRNPAVGLMDDAAFAPARLKVRPGCALYLFGPALFARPGADGRPWGLAEATPLLQGAPHPPADPVAGEPERLAAALARVADATVGTLYFP